MSISNSGHPIRTLASLLTNSEASETTVIPHAKSLFGDAGQASSSELRPLFAEPETAPEASSSISEEEFQAQVEAARMDAVREVQEVNSRELAEISERYAATFMRMDEAIAAIPKAITSEVVDLALLIAQELIHAELSVNEELVFSAVERALTNVPNDGTVTVCMNPDDLQGVQTRLEKEGMLAIKLEANSELRHGDCVVQMPDRIIDASLDARLEAVRDTLVRTLMAEEHQEDEHQEEKEESP